LIIKIATMKIENMSIDFHGILTLVFSPAKTENAVDKYGYKKVYLYVNPVRKVFNFLTGRLTRGIKLRVR